MKQLLILSGKGGTGKTTTASSFIEFSKTKSFADCDVDAPNLHLVTGMTNEPVRQPYYGSKKSTIDEKKCTGCGLCAKRCRFDAILREEDHYKVNVFACEGCGVCEAFCPAGAVKMEEDIAGDLMLYKDTRTFSTAKLKMGRGNSGKLVTEVKKAVVKNSEDPELIIIDGSPGIGCPVIASISGVDMVLIVAEPSLSGMSDMKRILKTCSVFGVKPAVCVNKYDTCVENTEEIERFCMENKIDFVGKIPYDPHVSKAVNEGTTIAKTDCPAKEALKKVYDKIINLI